MDTITPLSSIPAVGSSTSQGRGQQTAGNFPVQGQLLKALVLQAKGDAQFVLEIGGNQLTARSEAPLKIGQQLQLQVQKTSPQIELRIVTDTLNQFIGRSITLVGKNIDIRSLFNNLQTQTPPLLETLTPTSKSILEFFNSLQQGAVGGKDGGVILKQLIDNLGLNLEQLLARGEHERSANTLKAALLEIAHNFSSAEKLAETTNKLLTILELFQIAQLHRSSETHLIFPIPLPFVEHGYLVVERDGKEKGKETEEGGGKRFSLHLKMSELGNLSIDFLKTEENLTIRFLADSQAKADFIEDFKEELENSISGVSQVNILFSGDATDPIADLIREMIPEGSPMLDTMV